MRKKIVIYSIGAIIILSIGIGGVTYSRKQKFENYMCEVNTLISEQKYNKAQEKLVLAKKIKNNNEISNKENEINFKKGQNEIYNEGLALMNNKEYIAAINKLNEVDEKAKEINEVANLKIKVCKNELLKETTTNVDKFISENKFDDAYKIIETIKIVEKENDNMLKLKEKVDIAKNSYEEEQKRIVAEEEAKRIEEEKKNNQGIDLEKIKLKILDMVKEDYKKNGINLEELKKTTNKKIIIWNSQVLEKSIDGREGYFIPVAEDDPTRTMICNRFFVDKNTGEIFEIDISRGDDRLKEPFSK